MAARLETARTEVEEWGLYEYLVINDDFDRAADELWAIITAERCRRERKRETVETILKTFASKE